MVMKTCIICGKEFDARGSAKTCSPECSKENKRESSRKWCEANPEKARESSRKSSKKWREANPDYQKEWREANPEKARESSRRWREANPDYQKEWCEANPDYQKEWREANPEKKRESSRRWREANPDYQKEWREANPEKERERQRKWREANPEYFAQRIQNEVSKFCEQYNGDLEKILENIPTRWYIREAKMQVWFNESYADGIIAKIKSTPVCEVTGEKNNLVIHHLYSFNTHPELGNDLANMVRINADIHKAFHKAYGYGNNTPEQWVEFLENNI